MNAHHLLPGLDLQLLAARIDRRLAALGMNRPGHCLTAAVVTACELIKSGFPAAVQAGSASWRRITDQDAKLSGEEGTAAFSYVYQPDDAVSKRALEEGCLPEFHAWAGVLPSAHAPRGVIVDAAARWGPAICGRHGLRWAVDPLPDVLVVDPELGAKTWNERDGACYYGVSEEATVLAGLVARNRLDLMMLDGSAGPADDWHLVLGGPPAADEAHRDRLTGRWREVAMLTPAHVLGHVRRTARVHAAAAHAAGHVNAGMAAGVKPGAVTGAGS